jgi:hypothetical protein
LFTFLLGRAVTITSDLQQRISNQDNCYDTVIIMTDNVRLPKDQSVTVETYGEDSRKNALDSTAAVLGDGGRPARVLTGTPPLRNESVSPSMDGNHGMVDGDTDKRQARRSKQERKLNDKLPKWLSSSWVDKRKWKTFIRVRNRPLWFTVLQGLTDEGLNR